MESLVQQAGGTLIDAARAALVHPDVLEFAVPEPALARAILPPAVWRIEDSRRDPVSGRLANRSTGVQPNDGDSPILVGCVVARRGRARRTEPAGPAPFGFTLVDRWRHGLGPSVVTVEEVARAGSLMLTAGGKTWVELAVDFEAVEDVVRRVAATEEVPPGSLFVLPPDPEGPTRPRARRVSVGALIDLVPAGAALHGLASAQGA